MFCPVTIPETFVISPPPHPHPISTVVRPVQTVVARVWDEGRGEPAAGQAGPGGRGGGGGGEGALTWSPEGWWGVEDQPSLRTSQYRGSQRGLPVWWSSEMFLIFCFLMRTLVQAYGSVQLHLWGTAWRIGVWGIAWSSPLTWQLVNTETWMHIGPARNEEVIQKPVFIILLHLFVHKYTRVQFLGLVPQQPQYNIK